MMPEIFFYVFLGTQNFASRYHDVLKKNIYRPLKVKLDINASIIIELYRQFYRNQIFQNFLASIS